MTHTDAVKEPFYQLNHYQVEENNMLCYKDKTFCADDIEEHTCGRAITTQQIEEAKRLGLPIAWGSFCIKSTPLTH